MFEASLCADSARVGEKKEQAIFVCPLFEAGLSNTLVFLISRFLHSKRSKEQLHLQNTVSGYPCDFYRRSLALHDSHATEDRIHVEQPREYRIGGKRPSLEVRRFALARFTTQMRILCEPWR